MDAKVATGDHGESHDGLGGVSGGPMRVYGKRPARDGPNQGLYPSGYSLFGAEPSEALQASIAENEKTRLADAEKKPESLAKKPKVVSWRERKDQLWKGWILPASDADTWFAAGSAAYYRLLQAPDLDKAMEGERIRYRGLRLEPEDSLSRYRIEEVKGTLFLDALRRKIGDDAFLKMMGDYFAANTTKSVTAQSFLAAAGVAFETPDPGEGPAYLPGDIRRNPSQPVIVYGTVRRRRREPVCG